MVLDLESFTSLWLSLSGSGLNFCKQRFKDGRHIFFSLQNLKCLKTKNEYIEHLTKAVFGSLYVVTRFSISKQHFSLDKMH